MDPGFLVVDYSGSLPTFVHTVELRGVARVRIDSWLSESTFPKVFALKPRKLQAMTTMQRLLPIIALQFVVALIHANILKH
jgi:hypothetical protein